MNNEQSHWLTGAIVFLIITIAGLTGIAYLIATVLTWAMAKVIGI